MRLQESRRHLPPLPSTWVTVPKPHLASLERIRGMERRSGDAKNRVAPAPARNLLIAPLQLLSHTYNRKLLEPRSTVEALPALPNQTQLCGQFCRLRPRHMTALN